MNITPGQGGGFVGTKLVTLIEQVNITKPRLEDVLRGTGWMRFGKNKEGWHNRDLSGEPFLYLELKDFPKCFMTVTSGKYQHIFEYDLSGSWRTLANDLAFWEPRTQKKVWVN